MEASGTVVMQPELRAVAWRQRRCGALQRSQGMECRSRVSLVPVTQPSPAAKGRIHAHLSTAWSGARAGSAAHAAAAAAGRKLLMQLKPDLGAAAVPRNVDSSLASSPESRGPACGPARE